MEFKDKMMNNLEEKSSEEIEPPLTTSKVEGQQFEITNTFKLSTMNLENFLEMTENTLNSLNFTTNSAKLDETLIVVTFQDKNLDSDTQKDNKIALFQEQDNVYVQLKGYLTSKKNNEFWSLFNETIKKKEEPSKVEKIPETKEEIVSTIVSSIKNKGYKIEISDAQDFIENFYDQFNRLPLIKEINSIVLGYIKMKQSEGELPSAGVDIEEEGFTEDFKEDIFLETPTTSPEDVLKEISPSEALKEIIQDYNYLTSEEVSYYLNLIEDLNFEGQKIVVDNIEFIEDQFSSHPDLNEENKIQLRKELISLDKETIFERIRDFISGVITANAALGGTPDWELRNLGFLSESNLKVIGNMISTLPEERKQQVIERLNEIEDEFNDLEEQGLILNDWERSQYRIELVKLTKKNRKERMLEFTKDKKEEMIKELLFKQIPQLKFEDNEKIIKEFIWLERTEIDQRINKMKDNIQKQLDKKQKLFSKSSAGSTCSECGWPVGGFTKKCPRCGKKLIDWM